MAPGLRATHRHLGSCLRVCHALKGQIHKWFREIFWSSELLQVAAGQPAFPHPGVVVLILSGFHSFMTHQTLTDCTYQICGVDHLQFCQERHLVIEAFPSHFLFLPVLGFWSRQWSVVPSSVRRCDLVPVRVPCGSNTRAAFCIISWNLHAPTLPVHGRSRCC